MTLGMLQAEFRDKGLQAEYDNILAKAVTKQCSVMGKIYIVPKLSTVASATMIDGRTEARSAHQEQKQKALGGAAARLALAQPKQPKAPKEPKAVAAAKVMTKPANYDKRAEKFITDKLVKYIIDPYKQAKDDQDGMAKAEASIPPKVAEKAEAANLWAKEMKENMEATVSGLQPWPETLTSKAFWEKATELFDLNEKRMITFVELKKQLCAADEDE